MKHILSTLLILAVTAAFAQQAETSRTLRPGGLSGLRPTLPTRPAALTSPAPAASAGADDTDADPKEAPALNWDAAPVDIVFQTYGEQVGKTILKDPAVPGATITLKSREGQKLTKEEYLEAIEVVLEMNGIHLEPYGEKFMRAVPRGKARKEGIPLYMDIADVPESAKDGRVLSVMIPFKNIATEEAQKALEGFKSDTGSLNVFERTNSILVTDTWQNIKTMSEIARSIDIATPVNENVFVYQVENASASDIKTALESIVQESQKEQEKNGKAVQPQQNGGVFRPNTLQPTRLLGGNRPNQPEPQRPVESLVTSISDADRGMIRGKVLILADERSNKLIIITSKSNYDFFEKVIKQLDVETTPDTVVKVYRLKYAEAEEVSDMINDLIGNAPSSKSNSKGNQNQAARGQGGGGRVTNAAPGGNAAAPRKSANQRTGEAKPGELSKENTTVLADKRINGLVVMTNKELVPVLEQIIESMDVKLSQVLIETVIIEVSLGDDLQTGIDWVQRGKFRQPETVQVRNANGVPLYLDDEGKATTDITDIPLMKTVVKTVRDGFFNHGGETAGYMLGGGGGAAASALTSLITGGGTETTTGADGEQSTVSVGGFGNPIGSGINYYLKSDKLNLGAIIKASKTDSRTKYLASPVVMTLDNKEAVINATRMKYLLKGFQTSGNSYSTMAVPDYEQKELGIEIKVTPKINPNGTVMLTVEEKYSQVSGQQAIKYTSGSSSSSAGSLQDVSVPTTVTREMSADVLLENMQTVVFSGLTETTVSESETGIPFLKDLPWIGKWLFSSVSQSESRNELLVFMTPYVLDEGDVAQAEALRRKKALSDSRPWDDHGWSASPLADPVSKKEQLRRLKDEWKKQDQERQTKLAIEDEKVKRAKSLEKMTVSERDHWLELEKEELKGDARDELEDRMESRDEEVQAGLHALAAEIRERRLSAAEAEIKAADDAAKAENEHGRLEAEKAKAAAEAAEAEAETESGSADGKAAE